MRYEWNNTWHDGVRLDYTHKERELLARELEALVPKELLFYPMTKALLYVLTGPHRVRQRKGKK